ncbi:hypothetical protein DAPPUDRAFT_114274 [Daphnia pulex]|uniref:Transposase Helix-turn-helix domain-containing protein n=1 Tax=Daphnia pulex TaxID=6669 RepID=E9HHM1_DAPPU|nr:hypothetical protein DAPPUDRAFT_114274 [Daphnia pulex]|eukprot:EFX68768.1 hypothetical protein DAPPUDRAFT_114274 [Daphnia pulex]
MTVDQPKENTGDFSHLTGDVVTDAMSVSIQTCDIFSQAAYGVEPVLTEEVSQSAVVLIEGAMKRVASKSKQIDGIYSQATCDVDRSCVTEFALTEAFAWPTVDTVCKADKAAGTAPICLKNVGVNTDNCLKFAVTDIFITANDAVCLIFRKIRLNEYFTILGYVFGIRSREASRIFIRYVAFIADHMQEIIFWPKHDSLKRALPISFRKNYIKIQSIIDCFEVEIQKPSDPVNQALTWSVS